MFLLVKLHIDMVLEAVLPGPQNALYVMLCYVSPTWHIFWISMIVGVVWYIIHLH